MAVTACNDLEEEVGPMHVEEEVELTIQLHVPDMQASTRTAPTENITAITAYAFDGNSQLIKVVKAILSDQQATSGNLKIKVPKRTGDIHFVAKNSADTPDVSISIGDNVSTLLDQATENLHYWGMTTFDGSNINQPVTLYRNMAKLTLKTGDGFTPNSCYIAGFVNRNLSGTVVPGGHAVGDTPTIPDGVTQGNYTDDNALGNVYYLFEHANVKNNNPLYVIIEVDDKYYKIAFASGDTYFPILRNRAYEITVTESLDEMYAEADYTAAVNSQYPINDLVITSVSMTVEAEQTEVLNQSGQTSRVTVTIPEDIGITELNVPTNDAFTIAPPNGLTAQNGKYTVTPGNSYEFTLTVNGGVTAGNKTISFSGRGKYLKATGSANIGLYDNVQLTVTADPATIYNTVGSTRNVTVAVPLGITTLTIPDATTAEFIVSSTDVTLNNNSCDVSSKQGQSITFTLALRTDGNVGVTKTVTFNGSGQYKRATGSTTLTLEQAPAQEILSEYELWVENGAWNGSTNYNTFFTRNGDITAGDASNLESTFFDDGANAHKSQHMVMGQSNSISFTIPDTRYLTLLVASNNGNKPSIQLSNGTWATASSEDALVPADYNFGNGEIGTNGRLIRYRLPAGTYTLQGSNTSYLLYYLRVSTERPTMTDTNAVQVEASNYVLSWSDATMSRSLKKDDTHYFVDEEATTFTAKLNYQEWENVNLTTTDLTVSTVTWTFDNSGDESQGTKNSPTNLTYSGNESITDLTHNAGSYTLKGTVAPNASYKYGAFYDRLALKPVTFEAKNTIKVGLYNSWDGNAATVDRYNDETPLIIGFKMPQHTLPIEPGNDIKFTINKEWVRDASGSGIAYETNGDVTNYRIGNQDNHYHTRTEWTYKIQWRDVAAEKITVTTTDADVYFSYKGNISKTQTIDTPIDNDKLNIALDFYADVDNNQDITDAESNRSENGNVYNDLRLGTSRFFLKATISYEDAKKFASNGSVQLKGDYSTLNGCAIGGLAINWGGSKKSGEINCTTDGEGTSLNFTIQQNQTEYLIEWVFVPGQYYNNGGDIGFSYNIGNVNGQNYELSGETSADIAFLNENDYASGSGTGRTEVLLDSQHIFTKNGDNWTSRSFSGSFPIGTKITLNFSKGGGIKLCDNSNHNLHVPAILNTLQEGSYSKDMGNLWMNVPNGDLVLEITSNIGLYNKGNNPGDRVNLENNPLNGLVIESGETVLERVTVTYPQ